MSKNDLKPAGNKAKIIFLPAIVLPIAISYSLRFTAGILVGYIVCKIFCYFFVKNGRVDSIFLDYGRWKVHLHHWILGLILLFGAWFVDYLYFPTFLAGFICGIIIQDIYDYNDWHKVILKNEDYKK